MLKKLLLIPLLGSIMSLGAFASADTVGGLSSDSIITVYEGVIDNGDRGNYCSADNIPKIQDSYLCYSSNVSSATLLNYNDSYITVGNYKCVAGASDFDYGSLGLTNDSTPFTNCSFYVSSSPFSEYVVPESPEDSDSSLGIPEIPDSFTSGLTSLVNNFGGTVANWLPTIILVALGIYAIFSLFRVVRNYARSSFRG